MQRLGIEALLGRGRARNEIDLGTHRRAHRGAAHQARHDALVAHEHARRGVRRGAADEDDLYAAMDWLLERQGQIEKKLAERHLGEGSLALYDLTSSYFEGTHCPLGKIGYNRDGKKNKLQVN